MFAVNDRRIFGVMRVRLVRIVLLVLLAGAILVLSLIPDQPLSFEWFAGMDKVQHWIAYTVLGFLVFLTIYHSGRRRLFYLFLAILACSAYGGIIELLQTLTGRTADVVDFLVDVFGAVGGAIAALGCMEISLDSRRRHRNEAEP